MQLNKFPDFEVGNWGNIAALTHAETTQESPENSTLHQAECSETLDQREFNRLMAEEIHPRDQEALLSLFPIIAVVQKKIAATEFCRCQKIKTSH